MLALHSVHSNPLIKLKWNSQQFRASSNHRSITMTQLRANFQFQQTLWSNLKMLKRARPKEIRQLNWVYLELLQLKQHLVSLLGLRRVEEAIEGNLILRGRNLPKRNKLLRNRRLKKQRTQKVPRMVKLLQYLRSNRKGDPKFKTMKILLVKESQKKMKKLKNMKMKRMKPEVLWARYHFWQKLIRHSDKSNRAIESGKWRVS